MQTTVKVSKPEEYDIVIETGACDRIAEITVSYTHLTLPTMSCV